MPSQLMQLPGQVRERATGQGRNGGRCLIVDFSRKIQVTFGSGASVMEKAMLPGGPSQQQRSTCLQAILPCPVYLRLVPTNLSARGSTSKSSSAFCSLFSAASGQGGGHWKTGVNQLHQVG